MKYFVYFVGPSNPIICYGIFENKKDAIDYLENYFDGYGRIRMAEWNFGPLPLYSETNEVDKNV